MEELTYHLFVSPVATLPKNEFRLNFSGCQSVMVKEVLQSSGGDSTSVSYRLVGV